SGVAIELRQLGARGRALQVLDYFELAIVPLLPLRQHLARGTAVGVVPARRFHLLSPRGLASRGERPLRLRERCRKPALRRCAPPAARPARRAGLRGPAGNRPRTGTNWEWPA